MRGGKTERHGYLQRIGEGLGCFGLMCPLGAVLLLAGIYWAGPRLAPGPDAIEGTIEPGPLVETRIGKPFIFGRVIIDCLGSGRPFQVVAKHFGSRRVALRSPSGARIDIDLPHVGPFTDSHEWDGVEDELADLTSLDGVPGGDEAFARCPPKEGVATRWDVALRALRPGDRVVVGRAVDGRGPMLWRGDLASVHAKYDATPENRRRALAGSAGFLVAAVLFFALGSWMVRLAERSQRRS